jgi:hypothetical protein
LLVRAVIDVLVCTPPEHDASTFQGRASARPFQRHLP